MSAQTLSQVVVLKILKWNLAVVLIAFAQVAVSSCLDVLPNRDSALLASAVGSWGGASSKDLLGASTLFAIDNDAYWARPGTPAILRSAHLTALRFPGGEVADNYDWERHDVERPGGWPPAPTSDAERESRTDYREFLAGATKARVRNISFVVNLDGAFHAPGPREQNLKRYADNAARWVKAVADHGYEVRYWEIGNESYQIDGYPLTAGEYAQALTIFASAIRQVAPASLIGANGPPDIKAAGFADAIGSRALAKVRNGTLNPTQVCARLSWKACTDKILGQDPTGSGPSPWWPTVAALAGDSFDVAVVHRYARSDLAKAYQTGEFPLTEALRTLRASLEGITGHPIEVALTEWNTPNERRHQRLTDADHLLDMAVQLGNNAVSGVAVAHYWPLRLAGDTFKPLLSMDGQLTAVGRLFASVGPLLDGADVAQVALGPKAYLLQSKRADSRGLLLVNRGDSAFRVTIGGDMPPGRYVVRRLVGDRAGVVGPTAICEETTSALAPFIVGAPASSVTIVDGMEDR